MLEKQHSYIHKDSFKNFKQLHIYAYIHLLKTNYSNKHTYLYIHIHLCEVTFTHKNPVNE